MDGRKDPLCADLLTIGDYSRVTRKLSNRSSILSQEDGAITRRVLPSTLTPSDFKDGERLSPMPFSQTEPRAPSPCTPHRADVGPGVRSVPQCTQECVPGQYARGCMPTRTTRVVCRRTIPTMVLGLVTPTMVLGLTTPTMVHRLAYPHGTQAGIPAWYTGIPTVVHRTDTHRCTQGGYPPLCTGGVHTHRYAREAYIPTVVHMVGG